MRCGEWGLPNRLSTHGHVGRDDALLVDQIADRRGEHPVLARDLPVALQDHGVGQPMLGDFLPTGLWIAPADHEHMEIWRAAVELLQLRGELVARATCRIREDE